ncbi:palmitoyltransferase ZDHHC23-like [Antedon mediterranea]|uniref:palmitoyltransferase ZDHHC23-like n=1 Tax=Antedon mediterranea TaxID=105859 RepID=UPI003AF56103
MNSKLDVIDGPLCCCEYENINGEKSHVLAAFCDCEDVDSVCDRLCKGYSVPNEKYQRIQEVCLDRVRVPTCFGGGAKRIDTFLDLSSIPAIILLPTLILTASIHPYVTVIIYFSLPLCLLTYYQSFLRHRRRSKFFMTWGVVSVLFVYFVFIRLVVPLGHVSTECFFVMNFCFVAMLAAFLMSRINPGVIKNSKQSSYLKDSAGQNFKTKVALSREESRNNMIEEETNNMRLNQGYIQHRGSPVRLVHNDEKNGDSSLQTSPDIYSEIPSQHKRTVSDGQLSMLSDDSVFVDGNWCELCQNHQPRRGGHCRVCGHCVRRLDHHCVWIDSCVGEENHRSFLLSIILFIIGGVWGMVLSLQSVCRNPKYGFHVAECFYAYKKYSSAIVLSCSIYTGLACLAMLILLGQQIHLITHNWTYRERKLAMRGQLPRDVMIAFDRGFINNWKNFLLNRPDSDLLHV